MKIYIAVDIEGVSGVVSRSHTSETGFDYGHAREWMTGEASAAVEGAIQAGAKEVWVADFHGGNGFRNLLLHKMHPKAQLISGSPKSLVGEDALDDSFDALFLVGYHTRNRSPGVISHSINGVVVNEIRVNGQALGEVGLSAAAAGHYQVPTLLVTGDDATAEESRALIPNIEAAVVKWAVSRGAARCLSHEMACEVIQDAAKRALGRRGDIAPFVLEPPFDLQVEFTHAGAADGGKGVPGVTRMDSVTLQYTAENFQEVFDMSKTIIRQAMSGVS